VLVHRFGQTEELLGHPGLREFAAAVLQIRFHSQVRHAGRVREPVAKLPRGAVGGERNTACQGQALGLVSARETEPHDPPLQVAKADGHRVAPGGSADHDDLAGSVWKPLGERQCNHATVGRPNHGVEGSDPDPIARGDNRRSLVTGADRWERLAARWRGGRAPAA